MWQKTSNVDYPNGDKIMKNEIQMKNITFQYGEVEIFNDLSLTIKKGEHIAIVGANGSGKTTLTRILSGMLIPQSGTIQVDGLMFDSETQEQIPAIRKKMSVVLQNPEDQFVGSTVQEDIAFGLENLCVPTEEMPAIIADVAKTTKIEAFLTKEPHQLSGGQKQRVAIASSLALKTEYMIFDESTSQLDPQGKKEVLEAIEMLAETQQKTIIMITHDLMEIMRAQRVIVLSKGQIVADTTPEKLFTSSIDLSAYHLLLPKPLLYSQKLKEKKLIKKTCLNIEELVVELCK